MGQRLGFWLGLIFLVRVRVCFGFRVRIRIRVTVKAMFCVMVRDRLRVVDVVV